MNSNRPCKVRMEREVTVQLGAGAAPLARAGPGGKMRENGDRHAQICQLRGILSLLSQRTFAAHDAADSFPWLQPGTDLLFPDGADRRSAVAADRACHRLWPGLVRAFHIREESARHLQPAPLQLHG